MNYTTIGWIHEAFETSAFVPFTELLIGAVVLYVCVCVCSSSFPIY